MRPEVWGGVECSVVRVGDRYHDSIRRSGHDRRLHDVISIASLGVEAVRFPVLWEVTAPGKIEDADWRWADRQLAALRSLRVRPIAGLLHHGSGPRRTHLLDEGFAAGLAEYATAVARRYPWIEEFTPINEPLTTARFSALYGYWYPHERSAPAFLRALVHECKATVLAMEAIRAIIPHARLVQTEDFASIRSTPALAYQAEHENLRRWLSLDLLCGRVDPAHPLYPYLRGCGITAADLAFFEAHACPPDVIGLNYYVTSERFLDERLALYPPQTHGGNDRQRYADVEAVRVAVPLEGHAGALAATWARYGRPLAITEVHMGCTREEQLRWWAEAWRAASSARDAGIDVRAVCAWALFGSHDWSSLLVEERGDYEPGVFDVRSDPPRPTALARALARTAAGGCFDHPVLDVEGWWRRPTRVLYGPRPLPPPRTSTTNARGIIVTGATGTLGRAVMRACEGRGLAYRPFAHVDLDVANSDEVERMLDLYRPWAVVNAAGFVRVDDAEEDRDECWRANVDGPRALAMACARRKVRLATVSSDLVFDGGRTEPYVENDAPSPLNVYGASKAESERVVLTVYPQALIVRTSAFFGPWDEANFVSRAMRALARGERFRAANDMVVSPTYLPELVDWVLDLLIDDEHGLWHVANAGAVSWYELARLAAYAHGVPTTSLVSCPARALGEKAPRPSYSALSSARGAVLRPLDAALRSCAHARAA
jgi:dTDP-4-dehydrorhamnose reductase